MKKILFLILAVSLLGVITMKNLDAKQIEKAIFAGGCFWCMESPFENIAGVESVISGYTDGTTQNPTYENYAQGGHVEVIEITYDPAKVTYNQLLDVFWQQIDPTDAGGQFVDQGPQYRSAIFYLNDEQKQSAERSKAALNKSGRYTKPVITEIAAATTFYPAEKYHQDYYKNNPIRYKYYRSRSGRDQFLKKIWSKDNELTQDKKTKLDHLTPLQYKVTQEEGTEPAFKNEYWDNHRAGIYVDIVSGEPLFSSLDKFESGTGWPSFTQALNQENIVEKEDRKIFSTRTEVRSKQANSHLGHVFSDGPAPTGLRYCINSAALRFIPKEDLKKEGYGEYEKLFK